MYSRLFSAWLTKIRARIEAAATTFVSSIVSFVCCFPNRQTTDALWLWLKGVISIRISAEATMFDPNTCRGFCAIPVRDAGAISVRSNSAARMCFMPTLNV